MVETFKLKSKIRATYGWDVEDPSQITTSVLTGTGELGVIRLDEPVRLDLGAGKIVRPGHTPRGFAHGSEIFPLPYADGSVDEIVASHVLEHFPRLQVPLVVKEWSRVLRRSGRIRIAVPDFASIASRYKAGPYDVSEIELVLMGGQIDANDFHRSVFDQTKLARLMEGAGLQVVGYWISEIPDCAADPVSLNLEGRKW